MEQTATDPFRGKLLITTPELAAALSLATRTIYNGISRKTFPIPARKVGRSVRFRVEDVLNYVDSL